MDHSMLAKENHFPRCRDQKRIHPYPLNKATATINAIRRKRIRFIWGERHNMTLKRVDN